MWRVTGRSHSYDLPGAVQFEKTSVSECRAVKRGTIVHTVRALASLAPCTGGWGGAISFSERMYSAAPVE